MEVIVVDNASSDGTAEAIAEKYPEVELIRNDTNLGFARANNIGIRASSGKYLCLINSDVVVPETCLQTMLQYIELRPTIGVLGPRMRLADGSIGDSCMRFPTVWNWFGRALALDSIFKRFGWFGGFLMTDFRYDKVTSVDVLTGWFWMARKEAIDQVGPLDERYFMYGEDIEWCKRFRRAGWDIVFYPEAEAVHHCAASSSQSPIRFYLEMQRANMQYLRCYHKGFALIAFGLAIALHEVVRILGYGTIYVFRSSMRSDSWYKIRRSWECLRWLVGARRTEAYLEP